MKPPLAVLVSCGVLFMFEGLVSAKGTRWGVRLVLHPQAEFPVILHAIREKLGQADGFFQGAPVTVDTQGRQLTPEELKDLAEVLIGEYGIRLAAIEQGLPSPGQSVAPQQASASSAAGRPVPSQSRPLSDMDGSTDDEGAGPAIIGQAFADGEPGPASDPDSEPASADEVIDKTRVAPYAWHQLFGEAKGEANTLLVKRTIRSGQSIRFDGNVVVLGDANPGSEIVAAGDIIVMGSLRGMAHAGATGNRRAVVAALRLLPTQLRIADLISRAPDGKQAVPSAPEIARIKNDMVLIEDYVF